MRISSRPDAQDTQPSAFFESALSAAQQTIQGGLSQASPEQAAALQSLSDQISTLQSSPGGLSRSDRRSMLEQINQAMQQILAPADTSGATASDQGQLSPTDPGYSGQDAFATPAAGASQDPSQFNVADPTAAVNDGAARVGRHHGHGHKAHAAAMATVADDLGISTQDLRSALQSGQTIADLAQSKNVSLDQLSADVTSKLSTSFPNASPEMVAGIAQRILDR